MTDDRPATPDGGEAATAERPGGSDSRLDRIGDGFVTVEGDWRVADANEAARELLDGGDSGLVGTDVREVIPGVRVQKRLEEALASGEPTTVETRDTERGRWLEIRVYPASEGLSLLVREITDRRRTREELRASEQSIQLLHDLASDPDRSRSEKIARMLEIGRERLGMELGLLTRIEDDSLSVVEMIGDHPELRKGAALPLPETYCRRTVDQKGIQAVVDASAEGWDDDPAHERLGLGCYLGATISVEDQQYGTICFASSEPREREFSSFERTFLDLLTDWISYIVEQHRYEDRIRSNERRLETVTENVPIVVFALDPEGTYTLTRGQGLKSLEFEPDETVGESIFDIYSEYPAICDHARRALDGHEAHHTVELDEDVTLEAWYRPVFEDGEVTQVVGVVRDITEIATHRERLSGLLETTRSLMQARSRKEVAELVATASRDVLGFEANVVRLYDTDAERLELGAQTSTVEVPVLDRPAYDVGEGMPGSVFATGESRVVDDLRAVDVESRAGVLRSAMYYPMGVHGTISVASSELDAFDETDEQVLALLSTAASAACTRARRERQVRETREHLESVLERINGLIENTVEVLVGATTREELESEVVSELAATEPYTFAWIGRPGVTGETLSPREWAGEASVPVGDVSFALDRSNPVGTTLAQGTPQIVVGDDDGATALGCTEDGPETCIVIPIAYRDTTYGVAAVFADQQGAFDEREQVVLSALGRAVANAINAVERGRILDADRMIELQLAIDDPDLLFGRISLDSECPVALADFDYRADGRLRMYLTADCDDCEAVVAAAGVPDGVDDAGLIADNDGECLVELTVDDSLIERVSEFGAVVSEVSAEQGTTRVTVELPFESEARDLFELVERHHPGTDLVGYHEHERPVGTRQEFRASLADRFTDRQETALRTAYLGGFFDQPREIDGNDLADAMGVSRPTYHQHLRTAQRKVFEELFE